MLSEARTEATVGIEVDEAKIRNRYQSNLLAATINIAIMLGAAYELELKWVVAIGFGLLIATTGAQDARYFEIATRIARTNVLIRDFLVARSLEG